MVVIRVILGNITEQSVDAIVNSANWSLFSGSGIDGVIHRAAGPGLEKEARELHGTCKAGNAVVTGAHDLPARMVIHAVGPRYMDGLRGEDETLRQCYRKIFELGHEHSVRSMALPPISTGIYNYPFDAAETIAVTEALLSLEGGTLELEDLRFIVQKPEQQESLLRILGELNTSEHILLQS